MIKSAHHFSEKSLIASIIILMILGGFSFNMFVPALPAIERSFAAPHSWIAWLLSAGLLARALLSLVFGPAADHLGRRIAVIIGLAACFVGSLLCATAPGFWWVFSGRTLIAGGSVAMFVVLRAVVIDAFGRRRAAQVTSVTALFSFIAPLIAPSVGGFVTEWWGWRGIFWLTLCMQIASLLVVIFWLPETLDPDRRVVKRNLRSEYARLIKSRNFWGYTALMSIDQAVMFSFTTEAPFVMTDVMGYGESQYVLYYSVYIAGMIIGNILNSRMAARFEARRLTAAGIGIVVLAGVGFVLTAWTGFINPWTLFVPGALGAVGGTLIFINGSVAGVAGMNDQTATASGLSTFCQILTMAAGVQIAGTLYDRWPIALFWFMPAAYATMAATWLGVRRWLTE